MTITVDNASSNDLAIQYLRRRINYWNSSVFDGDYLHMRCAAHILNLIVKDGLKDLDVSIVKIRGVVKYVRSSPSRLQKFKECVEEEMIQTKSLVSSDVETRWNSTFLMLKTAVMFKKTFQNLHSKDVTCIKELEKSGGAPTEEDWKKIGTFLPFLKIFYDATIKLSRSHYVTGSSYVPEIYGIGWTISSFLTHEDERIRNMAEKMKLKRDKYWSNVNNINVLLFIVMGLHPRYKMKYVEWLVRSSYDFENAVLLSSKIIVALRDLVDFYGSSQPKPKKVDHGTSSLCSVGDKFTKSTGFDNEAVINFGEIMSQKFRMESGNLESYEEKSELDKYLGDAYESFNDPYFDLLMWWKDKKKKKRVSLFLL